MPSVLDEIVEKSASLTFEERQKLIDFLQKEEASIKSNGKKKEAEANLVWVKENRVEFAGKYVALENGKLVGEGRTIKEAHLAAKTNGVNKPLLAYIPRENEELWGGW